MIELEKDFKIRNDLVYNNLEDGDNCCLLKFCFNPFGIINEITFFGRVPVSYSSLISLVGLHENYLNDLFARREVKLVEDVPRFLSENWSMALFHDSFSKLILKLKNIILDKDSSEEIKAIINTIINKNMELSRNNLKSLIKELGVDLKKKVEIEILEFLFENRNHLPFYHIPEIN